MSKERKIATGRPFEETLAVHISRAIQRLRKDPDILPQKGNGLKEIIEKARKLTRLDINNWTIRPQIKEKVEFEGKEVPVHATSLYHEDSIGWGALTARQIDLEISKEALEREDLPEHILKELWHIVFNPYGPPERTKSAENKVNKIMSACKRLGWGRR